MNIKFLYLYLFSIVGLSITVVGSIGLIQLGFKTFVFKEIDRYEVQPYTITLEDGKTQTITREELEEQQRQDIKRRRQEELTISLSMIIVGLPLYLYHWGLISRETKRG